LPPDQILEPLLGLDVNLNGSLILVKSACSLRLFTFPNDNVADATAICSSLLDDFLEGNDRERNITGPHTSLVLLVAC
jgi:hypothetical protein